MEAREWQEWRDSRGGDGGGHGDAESSGCGLIASYVDRQIVVDVDG